MATPPTKYDRAQEVFGLPPKWLIRANLALLGFILLASVLALTYCQHLYYLDLPGSYLLGLGRLLK